MSSIQKWGFGMAPLKPNTAQKNKNAIASVLVFVEGTGSINPKSFVDDISWVKGIFNRVIKQDQWDWFTVNMYLDFPSYQNMKQIVLALSTLRRAILDRNDSLGKDSIIRLEQNGFAKYCQNYLSFDYNAESTSEYLYILSRREESDLLKIGMTTRNVQKRVNEINSATGVVFPFSVRKVFKVRDSAFVEKEIHSLLAEYRIRSDREFFRIEYSKACSIIDDFLIQHHMYCDE